MALPILTIAQMREWETATWASGQTELEVIRRVGKALAARAMELTRPNQSILILAGRGNNGEDARLAREHLSDRRVDVVDVRDPQTDLHKVTTALSLKPDLVMDGLFGIGLNRALDEAWVGLINTINEARLRVLSVDVPSGLNADDGTHWGAAIQAGLTITVGAPKIGLLQDVAQGYVGQLEVAQPVGLGTCDIKTEQRWMVADDFADYPPDRLAATHKGNYGHVCIVGGSLGYHGAAVLACRGAQRAQPGLITLYTPENVYTPIAAQMQAVMVSPWVRDSRLRSDFSAYLVGPGLASGDVPESLKNAVKELWRHAPQPVVVDASALDWLPRDTPRHIGARIITPHPGEAARLLRGSAEQVQANRVRALRELSHRYGNAWVVLKGHQTIIGRATGDIYVNSAGNPYMAQGGSGDLLAGFIVGLITQPVLRADIGRAIRYAVWQHGAAADHLQSTRPNWIVEDLAATLGGVRA